MWTLTKRPVFKKNLETLAGNVKKTLTQSSEVLREVRSLQIDLLKMRMALETSVKETPLDAMVKEDLIEPMDNPPSDAPNLGI